MLKFAKMDFNINFSHLPSLNDLTYVFTLFLYTSTISQLIQELGATSHTMLKRN